jgi:hypothetical protein
VALQSPSWDIVVLLLLTGGTTLCVTSAIIGWKLAAKNRGGDSRELLTTFRLLDGPALRLAPALLSGADAHIGLGQLLVVVQIALSLLLVLGAAIFFVPLRNLHSVEIGFNQENLLTFSLDASQAGYKDAALKAFYKVRDQTDIGGVCTSCSCGPRPTRSWSTSTRRIH